MDSFICHSQLKLLNNTKVYISFAKIPIIYLSGKADINGLISGTVISTTQQRFYTHIIHHEAVHQAYKRAWPS
jgi:hypothetical protein